MRQLGGPSPAPQVAIETRQPQPGLRPRAVSPPGRFPRLPQRPQPGLQAKLWAAQLRGPPGGKICHELSHWTPSPPRKGKAVRLRVWGRPFSPHSSPPAPCPGEALSVPPAGGAPTRRQRRRGVGVQGCDWKPGSTPCPAGRSPHEARIATLKPARRWRLQPPTCPSTSRRAPRACPPWPGSFLGDWPPSPDRRGHVCAGSAPGTARGPASYTPAAADPSIRRRGPRRNRLVRADVTSHSRRGAPRLRGRAALGWVQRKEPPGGHSPRALPPLPPPLPPRWPPRLAARPAAPKRGGASARRRARSAPGRRLAGGLGLPLLAATATALGRPQPGASPALRVSTGFHWASDLAPVHGPGTTSVGPADGGCAGTKCP